MLLLGFVFLATNALPATGSNEPLDWSAALLGFVAFALSDLLRDWEARRAVVALRVAALAGFAVIIGGWVLAAVTGSRQAVFVLAFGAVGLLVAYLVRWTARGTEHRDDA